MLKIQDLRGEKSLSQKDLAKAVGTSPTNIYRWENNLNEPTSGFIVKLCNVLECSADYLLCRSDDFGNINTNADLSNDEQSLINLFRQLPEIRKKTIIDTIRFMVEDNSVAQKKTGDHRA